MAHHATSLATKAEFHHQMIEEEKLNTAICPLASSNAVACAQICTPHILTHIIYNKTLSIKKSQRRMERILLSSLPYNTSRQNSMAFLFLSSSDQQKWSQNSLTTFTTSSVCKEKPL